jgi:Fic family protein
MIAKIIAISIINYVALLFVMSYINNVTNPEEVINMSLTYEGLVGFNLFESCEKKLEPEMIFKFLTVLQEIQSIDKFIKDSPSFPGSTDSIVRNEMISAIGATLSIEGTILDKEEIEESFGKMDKGELLTIKQQEASNSRDVYKHIIEFTKNNKDNISYSEPLIKQIHTDFTRGMNYLSNVPGEYRHNFTATFGFPRKSSLCRSIDEIENAMKLFVQWINNKSSGSYLLSQDAFVKAIMAHYYLTEIHPFGDGNGRTARALEALMLYAHGINNYCFWSLANFWSANKEMYLTYLHNLRETLDPCEFILWGLEGYREELKRIKDKVLMKVKRLMFQDYVQYLLRNKHNEKIKINHRIIDVIQLLIIHSPIDKKKFMGSPGIVALYRKSPSARTRDFQKMEQAKLIKYNGDLIEANYTLLDHLVYSV